MLPFRDNKPSAIKRILETDSAFPGDLKALHIKAIPEFVDFVGNETILHGRAVALLCSSKCPGKAILAAHDLAARWAAEGKTVISGFQSPVEKECLRVLLRGNSSVILCPARSLHGLRIPVAWRRSLEEGRLLLLSPFKEYEDRNRANLAMIRNELVAAIAAEVFVIHASPGGKLELMCKKLLQSGKPVFAS